MANKTNKNNNDKKHQGVKLPDFYIGLNTDNRILHCCHVTDVNKQTFLFESPSHISIVKEAVDVKWDNWEAFDKSLATQEEAHIAHKAIFGGQMPPTQFEDRVNTSLWIWRKMCATAADRTKAGNPINKDASGKRQSSLESRVYTLVMPQPTHSLKTPQAIACLKIVTETVNEKHEVTEKDLKAKIYERADELKTRQDPWRIFQYYRPQLIAAGLIRHN